MVVRFKELTASFHLIASLQKTVETLTHRNPKKTLANLQKTEETLKNTKLTQKHKNF
jgi:hypothetical protein